MTTRALISFPRDCDVADWQDQGGPELSGGRGERSSERDQTITNYRLPAELARQNAMPAEGQGTDPHVR
jgi:hypothetical protein